MLHVNFDVNVNKGEGLPTSRKTGVTPILPTISSE